jgi:branched-chain amino acid transport system ATP-binding protein
VIALADAVSGYGRAQVLNRVSLRVGAGEVLAIVGANGAGKTTLVSTIAGAVPLWQGQLELDGRDVSRLGPEDRLQAGIALCPEGRRILSTLTVEENLRVGATALERSGERSRRERIAEGLDAAYRLFPVLQERRGNKGGELSGGQQQMLAIARALMSSPRVLLLDEPSLGLAPVVIHELYALLGRLRESGVAMILVEESALRALSFADRAAVMKNGSVVLEGPVAEIREHPLLTSSYVGDGAAEPPRPGAEPA